ncbi:integrator complex subunit 1 [Gouania willdenowi]|uniref:integrator complex subunit 1 n=1 Tax=Gouania willdenowi TaxID=441366 RepID=UPI00105541A9|nr:integrator complex subunit 1 [Gouania willdenowi]XP_028310867.1 integrator complex subunit 1 [Gouania willdenowi]XP_028310868.1 integrator complex subunit 1 [Gouania willdenowi]XP_028310869.1 integrator complex subunit 1 [Gouania willdenowi]XP_028310870.1 integrator complex subunit 1 [Gouania willdenowi]XP_028310871.1 integrator complex subunit 1 [Gouania willdenowi]
MNRPKPTTLRRPSAAKPSGHPPPGDFIALGSKSQAGEPKAPAVLLKPSSSGLPADRKRESSSSLPSSSGLSNLSKRPKLSNTPPVSALGRLAEVVTADKRSISPSIKEPSVIPIEVSPVILLDEIEAAESEGNDDRIEGLLCGAVKQLKMNRAKPDITLYLSLMFLAKIKPNVFATEGIIEALCSLLRRDASINFKAKGNNLVSVLACNLLMAAYEEDENWPEIFVKVYIEDSLGERIWVDSSQCKDFVDNIQTAFGTKMPPKSMLLQADTGRLAGDLSAGNSPHPSTPDEDDSQTELLIAEEKLSPEDDGQVMPRYEELADGVEDYVLDVLRDQLNRRQQMDNVSRNLLRLITATCGYKEARLMAVQRLEMWLQNPKLTRPAQDLLMSLCMNCNTHGADDMEVISNLIKIRLKPKVLLNHYMLCVRELLNANRDNLATMVKVVIFNELSNARNPNNMQVLHTVLQHSPEQAPKFLAMVFQDLLTNKDDYLRASRALLREIIKQTKHEINFQSFCFGLMQERKEACYVDMEFKERFVIQVTDLLTVSMMLGITAQVKEAGIAWDKGEKKNLEVLRSFQNQIASIQRDAVWWLHSVVPTISKVVAKDYVHCLHKVLFTEQPETYYKWDNWPPESDRNFFLRLCSEVPLLEDTLMRVLVIGLSRDLPLGPADAMELADHLVKRAAGVQSDDLEVLRVERIQLIDAVLNLCTYHHPENIQLPAGYQPPNLAISSLYWKAWLLLLVVAAFNPQKIGLAAWDGYPTLKMLMEMVMTNNYTYPPCTVADEDTKTEMISRELQISQREKQEILAFESHLAAASTKQTITESNSLLLSQLTSLDPQGPPRRPPPQVQDQIKTLNQSLRLGHLLCRSRNPDFLLNIIQRQASSQSMPWLADLVQSSEGSLDVLPVQCLCEFLLHDAADDSLPVDDDDEAESREQRAKKRQRQQKQRQLLGRLQDLLLGPKADEQTTCEVLDYFLRRLSSSQVASRVLAMKGLSLVLGEGGLKDGEERDQPMEEDSTDAELLPGYQWLLQDLPKLPLFDSVRGMTSTALQQAIHMETDPQTISAYLIYLSQHAPVEEQASHNDLALDVARLIVERSTIMNSLFSKHCSKPESDAVLSAFLTIFSSYIRRMRKTKDGEDLYSWSESQDQVFLRWTTGETATMHILVVHAMVILLTLGPPKGESDFYTLLDIWFPNKKPLPTAFLVDTSEEALLLPDWLKLRMIRSEVSRLVDAALQDLEPQQLLLFVQSFGIPVSSMSKLLQYLDQAVSHDPQSLEENIMDKHYMAHLVEVQHERGATGGHTFHTLLSSSLPPRRDSCESSKVKVTMETPHSSVKMRGASHLPVVSPDDDLTGMLLQIFPLKGDSRWHGSSSPQLSLALQQALAKELMCAKQGQIQQGGLAFRLLQAIAALLTSAHAGSIVMSMHHSHALSCPLMRQLHLYQRLVSQDITFSSLFLKVIVEMLIWLDNPTLEGGPLKTLLKSFAGQNSHRHSDVCTGFFILAEALAYHRDIEVPLRAVMAMLKAGERCNAEAELISKVLQGLMEVKSPYLEELLSLLMTVSTQNGTAGPVAMVISLLLQESDGQAAKIEANTNNVSEVTRSGLSSGLLVDWLEHLDPEVTSVCSDLQQKLLFSLNKARGTPAYRPYLLALLTHQSNWSTLLQCIGALLGKHRDDKLDPSSALDFLWACSHIPRIWQGRDQKIPQKKTEKFVLQLSSEELISLVDLILSESELNGRETTQQDKSSVDQASCSLIQSRLPLLHSYCSGDLENIKKVSEYLINCTKKWEDSSMSKRCQNLLLQIYLHYPEVIQHVTLPEGTFRCGGAADSRSCKLDILVHRLVTLLADIADSKSAEGRVSDANLACRKLAVSHPVLLLRHLPMIAGLLQGRMHLNPQEFRQQNHMTFFSNVLAILELLQPLVFHNDHQRALQDCLLSFMKVLKNFQRTRSPLVFMNKFLQFTQKYITHDATAAIPYLQRHSDILQSMCAENPDQVQLKSLLAGLTLPVKSSSAQFTAEEKDDDLSTGSLPLVNISAPFSLSAADMTAYQKKISRGEAVEDVLEVLTEVDEKSRRSPEIIQYFINDLQRLMTSSEELCRNMAFSLALRCIQNNPCLATDFLPTFMYCMGSGNFDVVQTALRNLPEYVLLCQEHADILLHKAFLVGIYGQIDTTAMISESMKVLHMEATT